MSLRPLLLLTAAGLAGCVTPFRAPPDVAHLRLERADSPVLRVDKVWLERKAGPLTARGYVLWREEGLDTTASHVDVQLIDSSGRVLRTIVAELTPGQIVHRRPHPDYAAYHAPLDPLPADTVAVRVSAHEGAH
jgi:hypothetical protein